MCGNVYAEEGNVSLLVFASPVALALPSACYPPLYVREYHFCTINREHCYHDVAILRFRDHIVSEGFRWVSAVSIGLDFHLEAALMDSRTPAFAQVNPQTL